MYIYYKMNIIPIDINDETKSINETKPMNETKSNFEFLKNLFDPLINLFDPLISPSFLTRLFKIFWFIIILAVTCTLIWAGSFYILSGTEIYVIIFGWITLIFFVALL